MRYFLDSSYLIDFTGKKHKRHNQVKQILDLLFKDGSNEFVINRLVYVEVLRGIKLIEVKNYRDTLEVLQSFQTFEINKQVYDEAITFSRFCRSNGFTLKGEGCAAIDFIHFIFSKHYDLNMLSSDIDMDKLETKYSEFTGSG
ncbi:MAG: hypothetical protein QG673_1934 [Pseudomonadota bacterium]|nr:hypothetical protein [Pseudomonadota bacterium]